MASAAPAISSAVSPLTRKPMSRAPIWAGVAFPDMTWWNTWRDVRLAEVLALAASRANAIRTSMTSPP